MNSRVKRRAPLSEQPLAQSQLPDLLQRVYANRGVTDPAHLEMSIQNILPPSNLKGVEAAANLVFETIKNDQSIVIVGDYDADGATSTALAMRGLTSLGARKVSYIVPNRFEYGYGLTPEIVDLAQKSAPKLIITVDNGISSVAGAQRARDLGIDVLVTDHHLPGQELPNANVIVNPNQPGDEFESKSLAGVGVMFYVLIALRSYMRKQDWFQAQNLPQPNFAELLDLVALGTVADVVPLDRNNRILVEQGLRRIRAGQCCPGILSILKVAGSEYTRAVSTDLAFYVGPRVNAAGRLEDISIGIECLLANNEHAANEIATRLQALNVERREIESQMKEEAIKSLDQIKSDKLSINKNELGICIYQSDWHQGVIGILAARIKEKYYRPTIVFANSDDEELKGSARSIPGVHIRDVLDTVAARNPGIIAKFGGHAMAAGLSLSKEKYDKFVVAFNQVLSEWLTDEDLQFEILSDGELNEQHLNLEMAKTLRASGPWGQGFPVPVFDGEFRVIDYRVVGEHHLKLTLQSAEGNNTVNAIAFNYTNFDWNNRASVVHAAYELDVNHFRGIESPQLLIRHLEVRSMH
ncbi:MAG: single-stranded-DNA-specific exonuclease RecJ [Gammaproteobacteria bacterium]|nr:single-stranded-DNA-specific exonuclease RecJ [Gammaproteobacteria bacterium]